MATLEEIWPLFGLEVTCGPLRLRAVRDSDLSDVVETVEGGIHEPGRMPFLFPWTEATGDELRVNTVQHHWLTRAETRPDAWSIQLGVWREGLFVGIQSVRTTYFPATRTGETGSWLGRPHQGRGTGTLMRQAMCTLCFDHLSFTELTSGAFSDNPASLAVSRKVGYVDNGRVRVSRGGGFVVEQALVLTPDALVRPPHPVRVEGVAAVRRLLGIDGPDPGTA